MSPGLQPDLFSSDVGDLRPSTKRAGPRLWVRRLVLWEEPGRLLRNVPLRPGLNIIWTPDEADGRMGHGGGKTSLCRLLRYCLGEESFGTDVQRQLIGSAMPDAAVGAEVMLDGEPWVVVRPLGSSRRHLARPGTGLDAAFMGDMADTGIAPLRRAIAAKVLGDAVTHLPVTSADEAWEASLAWFSRDQECRLLDVLDWRAAETRSRSPVRHLSTADRLAVVRLLLDALTPAEIDAARRAAGHAEEIKRATGRRERISWVRDDVGRGLEATFGGDAAEPTAPDFWSRKARALLEAEDPEIERKVQDAERLVEEQRTEVTRIDKDLAVIAAKRDLYDQTLKAIGDDLPRAELRLEDAQNSHCPTCLQVIPPESMQLIEERQAERDRLNELRTGTQRDRQALQSEESRLKLAHAGAEQELSRRKTVSANLMIRARRFAEAKGNVTVTARYLRYGPEIQAVEREIKKAEAKEATAIREVADARKTSTGTIERLSALFDATVRFLLTNDAHGRVVLDDKGLRPEVTRHGALTAAAVQSLKVVAFDLASLMLSMEGATRLPNFWIHDSPREADLGLNLYHRLFDLALRLEELTPTPMFQYIVTTTTAPPERLQAEPWLRLTLSSSPATERLFGRDL